MGLAKHLSGGFNICVEIQCCGIQWLVVPVNAMPGLDPLPEPEEVFWHVGRCGELCNRIGSCWKAVSSPTALCSLGRAVFCMMTACNVAKDVHEQAQIH